MKKKKKKKKTITKDRAPNLSAPLKTGTALGWTEVDIALSIECKCTSKLLNRYKLSFVNLRNIVEEERGITTTLCICQQ